jgi:hypothetical protein
VVVRDSIPHEGIVATSRQHIVPILFPIQWLLTDLSQGVKQPERETDHLVSSNIAVKTSWSFASPSPFAFMEEAEMKDHVNRMGGRTEDGRARKCWRGNFEASTGIKFPNL